MFISKMTKLEAGSRSILTGSGSFRLVLVQARARSGSGSLRLGLVQARHSKLELEFGLYNVGLGPPLNILDNLGLAYTCKARTMLELEFIPL